SAKGEYFGASVINFNKNVSDPVTESLAQGIIKETRKGSGLISYLGHGSAILTEVDLGIPSALNNKDKPSVYLINCCSTGNAFSATNSYGEQFILQKDYGAVGWISTTSEGIASYLSSFSSNFYKNWFNTSYGKPIAWGVKQGIQATA